MDDNSVRASDPFDYAGVPTPDDAQDRERDCFYCLSGWVFLGSLDHDGEEVFDAVGCRSAAARAGCAISQVRAGFAPAAFGTFDRWEPPRAPYTPPRGIWARERRE